MEALGIDSKLLLAQIINFALFFLIFKKFIAKPFFSFLESAEKKEKEKERIMAELKKQEEKALSHQKEIMTEAKDQAAKILSEAKKAALSEKEEMVKKAHDEAADIRKKAERMIEDERAAITQKAKDQVLAASALLAKSALKDYIDEPRQQELVKKIMTTTDLKQFYEN